MCANSFEREEEEKKMSIIRGYVIQAEDGTFLAKALFWYGHDKLEDAYVHPESEIEAISVASANWVKKPAKLYPALYSEKGGTMQKGKAAPFSEWKRVIEQRPKPGDVIVVKVGGKDYETVIDEQE